MRDIDRGHAEAVQQRGQLGAQPDPLGGLQVGEGLVEQEHRRHPHRGPANRDPLPLPGREGGRLTVQEPLEPQHTGLGADPLLDLVLGQVAKGQPETEVVRGRQMRVKGTCFKDHGHVAPGRFDVVDHPAAEADIAAAERLKAGEQPQNGALAAPARADDHHQLAVPNVQGQVRDRRRAIRVHPRDVVQQDIGHTAQPPPNAAPSS
jgi:hypothetical protein